MLFVDTFTVPAATPAASPVSRELQIAHGIIHQVEVVFLDGPENEVKVALRHGLHRVVPSQPDASVVGNAEAVRIILWEPAEEPPYLVIIEAWSPDADYPHEVTVRVSILPREILLPPLPELGLLKRIGRLLFGGAT